ncbi:Cro/CI family transcriptional regulator [Photobacterium leiognathi]|uniref:Cro/CI family transcriptional regulator n=1 Tax=Photobacterium leiognathi TaxID=553611 RepID=UPI0002088067|nr:Cro/CI family transcriptional regulator [Photobacterium leiognathi]PSW48361.1 Cro/Cl family transcriptional regulator [Photobacterium leiognathi subsp. mandapamensis]GAA03202.1 hypothetical protein PMSV_4127 [Photobacterium leiognathi subsp. mandapamensis svers.1.1.]
MKTEQVNRHFGNSSATARACGLTPQAVAKWGETVPSLRQFQIEVITDGKLKSDFTKDRLQQES